jgi:hypothetical protein
MSTIKFVVEDHPKVGDVIYIPKFHWDKSGGLTRGIVRKAARREASGALGRSVCTVVVVEPITDEQEQAYRAEHPLPPRPSIYDHHG